MKNELGTFVNENVSCSGCSSLCCREGTAIPLTESEAIQIRDAGTVLRQMDQSECEGNKPGRGKDFYRMETDCGNLDPGTGLCGDYANRPGECRAFKTGSFMCAVMRIRAGYGSVELGMPRVRGTQP